MTGQCTGCGDCCYPIRINFTRRELKAMRPRTPEQHYDKLFMLRHWRRISHAEAARRSALMDVSGPEWKEVKFNECDAFDVERRRCTLYDQRPPICRDFPFYGKVPGIEHLQYFPRCGYLGAVQVPNG